MRVIHLWNLCSCNCFRCYEGETFMDVLLEVVVSGSDARASRLRMLYWGELF